jgi:hypothetical protein
MPSPPGSGARPRQILVIANETCASQGVVDEVRYRAQGQADVLVVAPALARTRLDHWLSSDLDRRRSEALARLDASIAAFTAAGLSARGHLGDADPLQALDDALRGFEPDEVVISTHPHHRSNWLERQVVRRARERYSLPITHVVVDLEHESATAEWGHERPPAAASAPRRMRVFHASDYDEALAIRSAGFQDAPVEGDRAGVWVTDRPPEAAVGDAHVLFALEVPAEIVEGYEQPGSGETRRFLLPAELLNRHGPPVAEGDWSE